MGHCLAQDRGLAKDRHDQEGRRCRAGPEAGWLRGLFLAQEPDGTDDAGQDEIEGIDLTLEFLRDKRNRAERAATFVGMPIMRQQ